MIIIIAKEDQVMIIQIRNSKNLNQPYNLSKNNYLLK
jgi:hypothetical protein